ncbi:zinc-binding dehydrogenase [Mycolicibacterium bacteremicum]|uniref:zinc-binding dehydrogenase n=1 Tax=Mycolicibacterium bacteremicum TaxID=564198 RepID=UPI0026EED7D8|nr:zinc-binding dehydrogenase [Mycolicibacterium bacteremicum]
MDTLTPGVTRAAVWTGGSDISLRQVGIPALNPADVLVRVRLATVCGSDLHTVSGRRPGPYPSILGHEAVGEVVAGPGLAVGQRIVWSVTVSCGACARCRAGRSAKCTSVRKAGHEPFDGDWPLSGSYAEHIVLPAGTTIAAVPDRMPDAVAAPAACATATVMATLDAAGPLSGRRMLVLGAGMLGLTAVAAGREAGADVQVLDRNPARVAQAEAFGARRSDDGPVDVAIDFTGSTAAIGSALARLDIGGRLVLAGSVLPADALPVDAETVVRRWLTITGVHNYEPRHLQQAVGFLDRTRDRYPWASLVTAPLPLSRVADALQPPPAPALRTAIRP